MKTSGICGRQSARKHRRRGDYVIPTRGMPGRFTWLHVSTLEPVPYPKPGTFYRFDPDKAGPITEVGQWSLKEIASLFEIPARLLGHVATSAKSAAHAAVESFEIIGKRAEVAILDEEFHPAETGRSLGMKESRAYATYGSENMVTVTEGKAYWPKRRNQHSRTYQVLRFVSGDVEFNHRDTIQRLPLPEFAGLIGKEVEP